MKLVNIVSNEKGSFFLILSGFVLALAGLLLFLWMDINFLTDQQVNSEKFGQFGDFIGGIVGSIWTLAGLLLFYIALKEQRKDFTVNQEALNIQVQALKRQIKEFKLQRQELESSRRVYEEQSKTLRLQQFESNFYALLNVYLTIKNNLNTLDKNQDYFRTLFNSLKNDYNPTDQDISTRDYLMVNSYMDLYNKHRGHLSHYFKSFYRILRVIDSTQGFEEREKAFYSKILRSQLTDFENLILYYNSHSIYGAKARPLILKYNLLKHIPLFNKPEFDYYYNIQANINLLAFSDHLDTFLTKHINESYEIDYETDRVEEKFDVFDCIVGIYFGDDIELKVFFNKDISENGIRLSDEQFNDFLLCFINDRILFSTYIDSSKVSVTKVKTETDNKKVLGVIIRSSSRLVLNHDKH